MVTTIITALIILLNGGCFLLLLHKRNTVKKESIPLNIRIKLIFAGIMSFISDTIGVGSFAVSTAIYKTFNLFEDEAMPGMNNGSQIIPGALASILFMQSIPVDSTTLITLVAGTCVGGVTGGYFMTRITNPQVIRLCMITAFVGVVTLIVLKQLDFIPAGGNVTALSTPMLVVGFFAMIVCGSLTSVGIGMFAVLQAVLFLMHVSPAVAFPIMTAAGAMQQPITTFVFLKRNKVPAQKSLIVNLSGCIGVLIALPIISHLNTSKLHYLLLAVLVYNIITIGSTYLRKKRTTPQILQTA